MVGKKRVNPVAEQALEWMLLLRSGEASDSDVERFNAWRRLDPRNEAEAARLIGALYALSPLSDLASRKILRDVLLSAPPRRGALKSILGFAAVAATTGSVANRFIPMEAVMHDLRTATGERQTIQLDDGSILTLNARSIADADFSASTRGIKLLRGEAYIEMAGSLALPFSVATRDGTIHAEGGAIAVGVDERATSVRTLDSAVDVAPTSGKTTRVPMGCTATFAGHAVLSTRRSMPNETSWVNGQLVAVNQPLAEVVERLRPYYRGWISVDQDVAAVGISGVFLLDQIDRAINSLVEAGPIAVSRRAGLWVSITRSGALERPNHAGPADAASAADPPSAEKAERPVWPTSPQPASDAHLEGKATGNDDA